MSQKENILLNTREQKNNRGVDWVYIEDLPHSTQRVFSPKLVLSHILLKREVSKPTQEHFQPIFLKTSKAMI
jgi:hypothetical protein